MVVAIYSDNYNLRTSSVPRTTGKNTGLRKTLSVRVQCSDCSFLCKERKWRTKEFCYTKFKICGVSCR
jgi:hypothetical protein